LCLDKHRTAYSYPGDAGSIDVTLANGKYKVQLLLYDGWAQNSRQATFTIEGESVLYDYMDAQGAPPDGTEYEYAGVLAHTVALTDGTLNICIAQTTGGDAPIGGLIIVRLSD